MSHKYDLAILAAAVLLPNCSECSRANRRKTNIFANFANKKWRFRQFSPKELRLSANA
jgi:hypothetical protein